MRSSATVIRILINNTVFNMYGECLYLKSSTNTTEIRIGNSRIIFLLIIFHSYDRNSLRSAVTRYYSKPLNVLRDNRT